MDISTIIGFVGSWGLLLGSIVIAGIPMMAFVDYPSLMLVILGSYATLFIYGKMDQMLKMWPVMGRIFKIQQLNQKSIITKLMAMSEKARREGLLALEDQLDDLDDDFLKKGMRMVVDGTDAAVIEELLSTEISTMQQRHTDNISVVNMWATLGPGLGMLGTVQGLIGMLRNLEDKSSLGPNMAVALITTFYGSILANLLLIPIAGKLTTQDNDEAAVKEMEIEGILSIQAGDNPRILAQKLLSYLDPKTRVGVEKEISKD
ncbi:MAG: MotA/TolQ/ExbB proton channel family protein [Spirochaetaceae bacterium]|jgi:chemotaxis protein MotA|nr:MotA/TolQ/ExbB proton channel family protein [Spirochaetaceae bacterium]